MDTVRIKLGDRAFTCQIADTHQLQVVGLSRHASLADDAGMLFVFDHAGSRTFHMAEVRFPIDMIGLDKNSCVTDIYRDVKPGSRLVQHFKKVQAVVEVPAGVADDVGLKVGDMVESPDEELSVEAGPAMGGDHDALDGGCNDENLHSYYKGLGLEFCADEGAQPADSSSMLQKLDQEWRNGTTPEQLIKEIDFLILHQGVRSDIESQLLSIKRALIKKLRGKSAQIVDEAKFVEKITDILFAHATEIEREWKPDALNGGTTEHAVVTRQLLAQWLSGDAEDSASRAVIEAASDQRGMDLIGSAFILAGLADSIKVQPGSQTPALVLYRTQTPDQ